MRGPFSTPITPLPGSFFHADPHRKRQHEAPAAWSHQGRRPGLCHRRRQAGGCSSGEAARRHREATGGSGHDRVRPGAVGSGEGASVRLGAARKAADPTAESRKGSGRQHRRPKPRRSARSWRRNARRRLPRHQPLRLIRASRLDSPRAPPLLPPHPPGPLPAAGSRAVRPCGRLTSPSCVRSAPSVRDARARPATPGCTR